MIPFAATLIDTLKPVMPIIIFAVALIASAVYVYIKKLVKHKMKKQEK